MSNELADRLAIQDVMVKYATAVDARDLDRQASCFRHDAVVTGFGTEPIVGRDAFQAYVAQALTRYGKTQHLLGNFEVTITGDTAHLRTYVQATHSLATETGDLIVLWAIYDDQLVRTDDGWLITEHRLERLLLRKIEATAL